MAMKIAKKPRLELLRPYSPSTIFVPEEKIVAFDENAIAQALRDISAHGPWHCTVSYLTDKPAFYRIHDSILPVSFYPVSFRGSRGSTKYHKQWSIPYLSHILFNPPQALCIFGSGGYFLQFVALCCKLRRVPYFIIAGDIGIPHGRLQQAFFRNARRVLVHTRWHLEYIVREKGIDHSNLEVFPIGIDTQQFAAKPSEVYFRADNYPRLLNIGRIVPYKGALEALQAFAEIKRRFPGAQIDVVGPHTDLDFLQQLHAFVELCGIQNAVRFPGMIAHDDLPPWYQQADLMIYPSTSDSFGMVVVESMSCGTPVIARRGSGGPDEIISHGEDGLVLEPKEMASAAIQLLEDRERLARMGEAARRKVEEQYSAARTKLQLNNLVNEIERLKHLSRPTVIT